MENHGKIDIIAELKAELDFSISYLKKSEGYFEEYESKVEIDNNFIVSQIMNGLRIRMNKTSEYVIDKVIYYRDSVESYQKGKFYCKSELTIIIITNLANIHIFTLDNEKGLITAEQKIFNVKLSNEVIDKIKSYPLKKYLINEPCVCGGSSIPGKIHWRKFPGPIDVKCIVGTDGVCPKNFSQLEKKLIEFYKEQIRGVNSTDKIDCCVCFEELKERHVIVPCGHTQTCKECIKSITSCPMCKKSFRIICKIYL